MITKLHVSKNLFDKDNATVYDCYVSSNGQWVTGAGNKTVRISCSSNTQYTLSTASTYAAFRIMETGSDNIPSDGSPVSGTLIYYDSGNSYTFTTSNTAKYIIFQANATSLNQWLSELMFNTGSTALPYEPYGDTWQGKAYSKIVDTTQQVTSFPVVVRPMENTIPSWTIKGNMVQDGTPSPSNIIYPSETGDRTGNLIDVNVSEAGGISDTGELINNPNAWRSTVYYDIDTTLNYVASKAKQTIRINYYDASKNHISREGVTQETYKQLTVPSNARYFKWTLYDNNGIPDIQAARSIKPMINIGLTALPYEPYGIKIPISSGGTNLFDNETASGYYNDNGTLVQDTTTSHSTTYIPVNGTTYTVSGLWYRAGQMANFAVYEWDNNKNWLRRSNRQYPPSSNTITFSIGTDTAYITLQVQTEHGNIMLNTGSTPLPYEPYCTTTPVYLGQVQSTRKIVKRVFDGTETWSLLGRDTGRTVFSTPITAGATECLCSHIEYKGTYTTELNRIVIPAAKNALYISIDNTIISQVSPSETDFKNYLAAQYSAGTPVTVWYVLATETTTTLNEPLRKIGTYSDSVSGTNLAVIAQSPTTIDVDTSLKPSEMDLTYTGLKMCGRKKCASLLADNPLCGIGTYKDTLDLETGTLTRKIQKIVLNGTESWSSYGTSGTAQVMTLSPSAQGASLTAHEICSHLPWTLVVGAQTVDGFVIGSNSQLILSRADGTDIPTWLASEYANGTPVTIWYALTSATTETIPVPTGLTGTVEGYLTRNGTPTPSNPIYPTADSVLYWQ